MEQPEISNQILDLLIDYLPSRDEKICEELERAGIYSGSYKQKIIFNEQLAKLNPTMPNACGVFVLRSSGKKHSSLERAILSALNDLNNGNGGKEEFLPPQFYEGWKEIFYEIDFVFFLQKEKPIIYSIKPVNQEPYLDAGCH